MRVVLMIASLLIGLVGIQKLGGSEQKKEDAQNAQSKPETRTYKFKAKIKENQGVTPFEVGKELTGQFTYDLKGKNTITEKSGPVIMASFGAYESERNAIWFQTGDLKFTGTGTCTLNVSAFDKMEGIFLYAGDLTLPRGWEMDHKVFSQSYAFELQNAPPRKVFSGPAIPDRLSLADFKDSREIRLDFFHGVTFPGGKVKERATVRATVENLEEVVAEKGKK